MRRSDEEDQVSTTSGRAFSLISIQARVSFRPSALLGCPLFCATRDTTRPPFFYISSILEPKRDNARNRKESHGLHGARAKGNAVSDTVQRVLCCLTFADCICTLVVDVPHALQTRWLYVEEVGRASTTLGILARGMGRRGRSGKGWDTENNPSSKGPLAGYHAHVYAQGNNNFSAEHSFRTSPCGSRKEVKDIITFIPFIAQSSI